MLQADEGRTGNFLAGMEAAAAASTAVSFGLTGYINDDKAATAAVNAAASAVRREAAAGSALFLQQRYLESEQAQARSTCRSEFATPHKLICVPACLRSRIMI